MIIEALAAISLGAADYILARMLNPLLQGSLTVTSLDYGIFAFDVVPC